MQGAQNLSKIDEVSSTHELSNYRFNRLMSKNALVASLQIQGSDDTSVEQTQSSFEISFEKGASLA